MIVSLQRKTKAQPGGETTARRIWEVLHWSAESGEFPAFSSRQLELIYPIWTVDMSSLTRNIKLVTTTEDLLWTYADTPNNFPLLPLTATASSNKGETRTFNIMR